MTSSLASSLLWNNQQALAGFVSPSALLAFDFDGTLAPVVRNRDHAFMRDDTLELFTQVCKRFRCAVISGRSRQDVMGRLGSSTPIAVIGNHGAESSDVARAQDVELMKAVVSLLADSSLKDLDIENKKVSLSVHYWNRAGRIADAAPEPLVAESVLHERLSELEVSLKSVLKPLEGKLRYVPGHRVINLVPANAPNKGDALVSLVQQIHAHPVLYVGDDITDEDAFRVGAAMVTGVKVGCGETTAAQFCIESQNEMDRLLRVLLELSSVSLENSSESGNYVSSQTDTPPASSVA